MKTIGKNCKHNRERPVRYNNQRRLHLCSITGYQCGLESPCQSTLNDIQERFLFEAKDGVGFLPGLNDFENWKTRVFAIAEKVYPGEGRKMVQSSGEDCMREAFEEDIDPSEFFQDGYMEGKYEQTAD